MIIAASTNIFVIFHRDMLLLKSITLRKEPPSVIVHAGITLRRSKRLKSQLYSPLIARSCVFELIASSREYMAAVASERCPRGSEMGVHMGVWNRRG